MIAPYHFLYLQKSWWLQLEWKIAGLTQRLYGSNLLTLHNLSYPPFCCNRKRPCKLLSYLVCRLTWHILLYLVEWSMSKFFQIGQPHRNQEKRTMIHLVHEIQIPFYSTPDMIRQTEDNCHEVWNISPISTRFDMELVKMKYSNMEEQQREFVL